MEDRLQILKALYGEADDDADVRRLLREDAQLWQEYQAMSEVQFTLDHRPRHHPPADVTAQVLSAAAGAANALPRRRAAAPRRERPAVASPVARRRARALVGAAAAVIAVLIAVGIGLHAPSGQPASQTAAREQAVRPAPASPAPLVLRIPSVPEHLEAQTSAAVQSTFNTPTTQQVVAGGIPAEPVDEADLDWEASEDLVDVYRRIEILGTSLGGTWDDAAVPLEGDLRDRTGLTTGTFPAAQDGSAGYQRAVQTAPARDRRSR